MAKQWSDDEKNILREKYPFMPSKEISAQYLPNRTPSQITDYAKKKLKIKKDSSYRNGWSEEQLNYLKENYTNPEISIEHISKFIGKSASTINHMANSLGLYKESNWSKEDFEIITLYYPTTPTEELQKSHFKDRTIQQIISFANRNGVFKDKEHQQLIKAKVARENIKHVKLSGENHPKWVKRVKVNCSYCGSSIERTENKIKKSKNHYCNYSCMGNWMSKNNVGENNSNYGNGKAWTEEMRLSSAQRSIERLVNSDFAFSRTKPETIVENMLDSLHIKHLPEFNCKYYLVDKYLPEHNLMIEIQGNFYHCNPTMNLSNNRKNKIIRKDRSKNTYIKKYKGINILYLWEKDILEREELCMRLIEQYIISKGVLDNYHSFNYITENGNLKIINELYSIGY